MSVTSPTLKPELAVVELVVLELAAPLEPLVLLLVVLLLLLLLPHAASTRITTTPLRTAAPKRPIRVVT
jgi:hypothetical protein